MNTSERESIFREVVPIEGFYPLEEDKLGPFVWSKRKFIIRKPQGIRFLDLFLCYHGLNGKLIIGKEPGDRRLEINLTRGWIRYAVDLHSREQCDLEFEVTPLIPVPGESRELGVIIREVIQVQSMTAYELVRKKMVNKCENVQEFFSGRSHLNSLPTKLGVDIENRCNMIPRCSYCEWEWVKEMEKDSSLGEPLATFQELGRLFDCAEVVANFGHGEPLLNPNLEAILRKVDEVGACFEMTSNGHLLDQKTRSKLLGKNIGLNISIDAASAAGYNRFRDGSLDQLLDNIQSLSEERRDHDNLPKIWALFIAMRSNVAEFEFFLDRMMEVGVDGVRVKGLAENPILSPNASVRKSRGFDYQHEILPLVDLASFLDIARTTCESRGAGFVSEIDFCREFEELAAPICSEPWQALYTLRRGVLPCCYSRTPLAPWQNRQNRPLIEFVAEVWNGSLIWEIREALASGQFHDTCMISGDCPIVKRKSLGL